MTELRRSKRVMERDLRERQSKTDFLTKLPQEMTIEILGRLRIKNITRCKCVCKSWRDLVEGGTFATSYTPKPCLVCVHQKMGYAACGDPCTSLFGFFLPHRAHNPVVVDSANGLLLLRDGCANTLFVCNPMTREYAEIPPLSARTCFFGFGVSKLTGRFKILCGDQFRSYRVCTLGGEGGLWRSITTSPSNIIVPRDYVGLLKSLVGYDFQKGLRVCCLDNLRLSRDYAVFFKGNLHWLEYDFQKSLYVCCFDLDTELFTGFSLPDYGGREYGDCRLCVLEGKLCFCDILESHEVIIWWMNNYGDENSWTKLYTFLTEIEMYGHVYPLRIFANGDLLFTTDVDNKLLIFSENLDDPLDSFRGRGVLYRPRYYHSNIVTYTPSFLSLKTMGIHNVQPLSLYPLSEIGDIITESFFHFGTET